MHIHLKVLKVDLLLDQLKNPILPLGLMILKGLLIGHYRHFNDNNICFMSHISCLIIRGSRGGAGVGQSVCSASEMLGVRISAATDLSRLNRKWQLHCSMLGIRCECHGSSEMTIINGCSMSQQVWHAKEPSMINGHKCRAQVKICNPSPATMTSPNE